MIRLVVTFSKLQGAKNFTKNS